MLAAIEDKHVVVPVYVGAADFLKGPAGPEFCPVLHGFVGVCAAANGSHARAPPFVAGGKLVMKQKVGPASSELNGRNCSNSLEHFPYTAWRCWHIDVAQSNTTVESVDHSVDDRGRRADSASLTRALDAQRVGCRRHVMS